MSISRKSNKLFNHINNKRISGTASFWRKFAAFIIDLAIINIIIISKFRSTLQSYFSTLSTSKLMSEQFNIPYNITLTIFFMTLLVLLYFSFFDYYLGQTPGKMITRIKVIQMKIKNKDGSVTDEITLWRAVLRNCYILPFFPFMIFWIVEPAYLWIYNERFLEKITNTRTVDVSSNGNNNYKEEYKLNKV